MSSPPYSNGRVHVMADKCETCVFRPGNPMQLQPGRLAELVAENRNNQAALVCHKTTYDQSPQEAICRGYYDAFGQDHPLRLARHMRIIEEVNL